MIPPIFNIELFPMGSISLAIFAIFIGAAILKYNVFRFKTMIEPGIEKKKAGEKRYKLEPHVELLLVKKIGLG